MKRIEIIKQSKSYAIGYEQGKKDIIQKILKFVDNECEFIPNVHSDSLLDRLVDFIKNIKD